MTFTLTNNAGKSAQIRIAGNLFRILLVIGACLYLGIELCFVEVYLDDLRVEVFDSEKGFQNSALGAIKDAYSMPKDEKVLVYTPSGGFNNQIFCLLEAVDLAKNLNRSVIVPHASGHHDLYSNYLKQEIDHLLPMNEVLDLEFLQQQSKVKIFVLINVTLNEYISEIEDDIDTEMIHIEKKGGFTEGSLAMRKARIEQAQKSLKSKVVFRGRFYVSQRKAGPLHFEFIRYSKLLQLVATEIIDKIIGTWDYNCIHLRLGDKKKFLNEHYGSVNSRGFDSAANFLDFHNYESLYIASDGSMKDPVVRSIQKKNKKRLGKWWNNKEVSQLGASFRALDSKLRHEDIRMSTYGQIEQLMCTYSTNFVGSSYSTFSTTIQHFRASLNSSAPFLLKKLERGEISSNRKSLMVGGDGKFSRIRKDEFSLQKT